jgi:hypothetical protein
MNSAVYWVKSSNPNWPSFPDHTIENPRHGSSSDSEKLMVTVKTHCYQGGTKTTMKSKNRHQNLEVILTLCDGIRTSKALTPYRKARTSLSISPIKCKTN